MAQVKNDPSMKTESAKLYLTRRQEADLLRFMDVSRWVYNKALEHRIKAYKRRGESPSLYSQQILLTQWRSRISRIGSVPAQIERDALRRVDRGMTAFFLRCKAGAKRRGFPNFKSRNRWRSFEVLQPGKYLRAGHRIHVPGLGSIKYRGLRKFNGTIQGIRVIHKASGWYVQLIVKTAATSSLKRDCARAVGIDVGLTSFATLSSGEQVANPRWHQRSLRQLCFLQRIVSRRKKGSGRRRRAIGRVARLHERIANGRSQWIHKLTKRLVESYDLIAIEDLNIKGLAQGRLSKSILDAAWAIFAFQLAYKAEIAGSQLIRVDPRGTSQECSACGATVQKTLSDRIHKCPCGYIADRDVNAARNILRRATTPEVTRGECTLAGGGTVKTPRRGTLNREVRAGLNQHKAHT